MVYFIYRVLIQIICNKMFKEANNMKLQNFKRSLVLIVVAIVLVVHFYLWVSALLILPIQN